MILKFLLCIVALMLTGVASWFALWIANVVIYILSLPFSSLITDVIVEHSSDFVQFVYYAITTGILYLGVFGLCFDHIYNRICCVIDEYYILEFLLLIILVIFIIMICDPRLNSYLPNGLIDIIKNQCHYYLLGQISWGNLDLSGSYVPAMQYLVFDIAVVIAGLLSRILRTQMTDY